MKRGLKYYISFEEHDLVQMIDWWDYLCEIKEDYEPWAYYPDGKPPDAAKGVRMAIPGRRRKR